MDSSKKIIRDILPKKQLEILEKKEEKKNFLEDLKIFKDAKKDSVSSKKAQAEKTFPLADKAPFNIKYMDGGKRRKKFFSWIWRANTSLKLIILILILGVLGMRAFFTIKPTSVVVQIVPAAKPVSINTFLKAAETGGDINFKLAKFQLEKEWEIKADGAEKIERKASGEIVVYNNWNTESQVFIKNTRFETPEGKIYRIDRQIIVPGAKKQNGKLIPGSIETVVYADKAGEEYNIGLTDFVLPALREQKSPRYEKIYARSKTVIEGGLVGTVPKVNEKDLEDARKELEKKLNDEILSKAFSEIGKDFIFIKESAEIVFSYEILTRAQSNNTALLKEKADFTAPIFQKDEITDFLAKNYLKGTNFENNVYLKDMAALNFNIIKSDLKAKEATLKIDGEAEFFKKINEEELKKELIQAEDKKAVFATHPEIEKAKIIFKSFWKTRFPKDPSLIKIVLMNPVEN